MMGRRAFLGALASVAGSLLGQRLLAGPLHGLGRSDWHDRMTYSCLNYWAPRVYPAVGHCRGVTRFEEPPGAKYHLHPRKFINPDFVDYHGAYSGYGAPAALMMNDER